MKAMKTYMNTLLTNLVMLKTRAKKKLEENDGQFVMDHAAVFIIIIVLAGISLALLSRYVETDFANSLKQKINELFSF